MKFFLDLFLFQCVDVLDMNFTCLYFLNHALLLQIVLIFKSKASSTACFLFGLRNFLEVH